MGDGRANFLEICVAGARFRSCFCRSEAKMRIHESAWERSRVAMTRPQPEHPLRQAGSQDRKRGKRYSAPLSEDSSRFCSPHRTAG